LAEPLLLGIDVGTTAVKAVVVADTGQVVGEASAEYRLSRPREGWVEQEPEDWWRLLVRCTREACKGRSEQISALALSTQGDTAVALDEEGRALRPAITWLDTRAGGLTEELRSRLPLARWYELTGTVPGPFAAALKVPWLRQHEPTVAAGMKRYALVADFLCQRLTGRAVVDLPNASRTLVLDIRQRAWCPELLDIFGIPAEALPEVRASGEPIGGLLPEAAAELGLRVDTVVCTGGHDQTCAAVGAGVTRPGEVLLSCGTAWVVLAPIEQPPAPEEHRLAVYCHAARDRWAALGAYAGGSVFNWLRDEWSKGEVQTAGLETLAAEAEQAGEGAPLLFLPHFYGSTGPARAPEARGALIGLSLHTSRGDIVRALFEGVAFETRSNVRALEQMATAVSSLRMIGGGAKSRLWAQIVADVCGVNVLLPVVREAAAYGAALLAGVGVGIFDRTEEITDRLTIAAEVQPDPNRHQRYERQYELYINDGRVVAAVGNLTGGAGTASRGSPRWGLSGRSSRCRREGCGQDRAHGQSRSRRAADARKER